MQSTKPVDAQDSVETKPRPRAVLFVEGDLPESLEDVELISVTSNTLGAIVARRC